MYSLLGSLLALLAGYIFYGRFVESVFAPDRRKTPAYSMRDGVDYMPIKTWKATLIQLLNIAGTGPIFGALMGACFGPIVFLWIVLGSILGGAVHDYMSGMISERHRGRSIAELSGHYLGPVGLYAMRIFSVLLLVLTGAVFITTPAMLLSKIYPSMSQNFWVWEILLYYALATFLPISHIIGWLYPIFGALLSLMAMLVFGALMMGSGSYVIPEITLANLHPNDISVWPFMFITVACGAISGFHSTQSPLMAKCMTSEKAGRKIFYGAMILEAAIALIWAAAGMAFYGGVDGLSIALAGRGPSGAVFSISNGLLGAVGGVLAVIGVVVCPITSGDTSFRVVRMIVSEWLGLDQNSTRNRIMVTLPLILVAAGLTQIDFNALWRYFSWANQTLAMVALWVATAYLIKHGKSIFSSLLTALPATFMTAVTITYILMAPEGFKLDASISYPAGGVAALVLFAIYLVAALKPKPTSGFVNTFIQDHPSEIEADEEEGPSRFGAVMCALVVIAGVAAMLLSHGSNTSTGGLSGLNLASIHGCTKCHALEIQGAATSFAAPGQKPGPTFNEIGNRYSAHDTMLLKRHIKVGSAGNWGDSVCPPHAQLSSTEVHKLVLWMLAQRKNEDVQAKPEMY